MRRCVLVVVLAAIILGIAGCGQSQQKPYAHITKNGRFDPKRLGDVATPAVGDVFFVGSGQWSGSPTGFAYAWKDCDSNGANCTAAAGSPTNTRRYQVVSGDAGFTLRVAVTASYSGHPDATVMSAPTGVVPSGSTVVGTAAAPTPTCSTTVAVNGNVDSAVSGASTGATVCLASGSWSEIDLTSGTSHAVTLAAATPGGATVNGIVISAATTGLTIEGLKLSHTLNVSQVSATSDTFEYNTLENWGTSGADAQTNAAFYVNNGTGTITSLSIQYNQIDSVPQCWQDSGNGSTTFSHNVCGPDIGHGPGFDVHYTQSDGVNNDTISNNAFIGPETTGITGSHPNVIHMSGSNDTFDNNILWHVDGVQHLQINDDFASTALDVSNNLDVEDPSETEGAYEQIDGVSNSVTGLTQNHNTVIGVSGETADDYTITGSPSSCTFGNNIGVGNSSNVSFTVSTSCTRSNNVSQDTTAPGTGSVTNWTPSWQGTTWTPTTGSPWSAPPSNYYKPVAGGGVTSSMGYQGTIGP